MLEVYILAYNNLFCVEYQIKTFKAFCKDPYNLVIIDSNCGDHQENTNQKKMICEKYGVEFMSLPKDLAFNNQNGSVILGKKLNYVFHNIVKNRKPKYFAFIDQDFFPFREFSVVDQLDKFGMYGDLTEPSGWKSEDKDSLVEGPWMIHPWLSFYRFDLVKDFDLDFEPVGDFDTGGKNWFNFISKTNLEKKNYWVRDNIMMYFPWHDISNDGPQGYEKEYFTISGKRIYGQVQIYDRKFIHILNSASFSDDFMNPKTNWCRGFLDSAILLSGNMELSIENGFYNKSKCKTIY